MTTTAERQKAARDAILNAPDLDDKKAPKRVASSDHPIMADMEYAVKATNWDTLVDDDEVHQADPTFDTNTDLDLLTTYSTDEPWGRMGGEDETHFLYFTYFRSLGLTRTRAAVSAKYGAAATTIAKLYKANDWDRRVRAWDRYKEELYNTELVERTREMAGRHAETAAKGIRALSTVFETIVDRLENNPLGIEEELAEYPTLSLLRFAKDAASVMPNLMNAERLSRGLPTELTARVTKNETVITVRTSDELAEIVNGLLDLTGTIEGEVVSEDFDDDGDGEAAT